MMELLILKSHARQSMVRGTTVDTKVDNLLMNVNIGWVEKYRQSAAPSLDGWVKKYEASLASKDPDKGPL